ncbi:hypothetical protein BASA81_014855 [Batrachochytrium salamandrivorans]|nr:hypothetical protein BASA81_014855 [Batrachochytrium salamandrivorans]
MLVIYHGHLHRHDHLPVTSLNGGLWVFFVFLLFVKVCSTGSALTRLTRFSSIITLRTHHDDPACILSIDLQSETPWEERFIYFFYVELTVDLFLKPLGYSVFFLTTSCITTAFHSIVRDLYMTLCSFIQRCGDLIKYHRATANMDQRYSNATATELAIMDRVCIICRGEMIAVPGNAPPDEAVGIAARAATAVGAVDAGSRQSVMDIPAQAPVQPAIVNPVAAVNPIAINVNDNVPQPAGAVHPHQYPQAPPAANAPWWSVTLSQRTSSVYGVSGYLDQF